MAKRDDGLSCERKNIDLIEVDICRKGDECGKFSLGIDLSNAPTSADRDTFLRNTAQIVIDTVDRIAAADPLESVNVGFKDWTCGGGDLANFRGHKTVIGEFQKQFGKRLKFAHDYIDLTF